MMILEEAIAHAEEKSKGDSACAREYAQLAEWLKVAANAINERAEPKDPGLLVNILGTP